MRRFRSALTALALGMMACAGGLRPSGEELRYLPLSARKAPRRPRPVVMEPVASSASVVGSGASEEAPPPDKPKTVTLEELSMRCDAGVVDACMALAEATSSKSEALQAHRKACRLGVVEACRVVARAAEEVSDPASRYAMYLEACEGGASWACGPAAMSASGKKALGLARRRELLAIGCENGFLASCDEAASLMSVVDYGRALALKKLGHPPPPKPAPPPPKEPELIKVKPTKQTTWVKVTSSTPEDAPPPVPPAPPTSSELCGAGDAKACALSGQHARACTLGLTASCDLRCKDGHFEECRLSTHDVRAMFGKKAALASLPALFDRCASLCAKMLSKSGTDMTKGHVMRYACEGMNEIVEDAIDAASVPGSAEWKALTQKMESRCGCVP